MPRLKRISSIYDFADYAEFMKDFLDDFPDWYYGGIQKCDTAYLCRYCGKSVPATRKIICSDMCDMYYRWAIHDTKINSLRRAMHVHHKFECCDCHTHLSYKTPADLELPLYSGEVDHKVPLKDSGDDLISNLQLLCFACHAKKTRSQY